jgi:hypothetical protein
MGAGHAYGYDYFMLFSEDHFYFQAEDYDGNAVGDPVFDEQMFDDFIRDIARAFKADVFSKKEWTDRSAYHFAETNRLYLGIDAGGGTPCLFAVAKCWEHPKSGAEKEYVIDRYVDKGFNKLIKNAPGFFRCATSAWTSSPLTKY